MCDRFLTVEEYCDVEDSNKKPDAIKWFIEHYFNFSVLSWRDEFWIGKLKILTNFYKNCINAISQNWPTPDHLQCFNGKNRSSCNDGSASSNVHSSRVLLKFVVDGEILLTARWLLPAQPFKIRRVICNVRSSRIKRNHA